MPVNKGFVPDNETKKNSRANDSKRQNNQGRVSHYEEHDDGKYTQITKVTTQSGKRGSIHESFSMSK